MPTEKNNKTCICGSTNIRRENNVGSDLIKNGYEEQHIDYCLDCGKARIVCDWHTYSGEEGTSYSVWYTDSIVH